MNKPVLELQKIKRVYGRGDTKLSVLRGIDLTISAGEIVALVGPSGSGKSTLLHIAGLLDTPTAGHIFVMGREATKMNDYERTLLRRDTMGFVYQSHLLLPDFSALENVMMPQLIAGKSEIEAKRRAIELLERVGLSKRMTHRSGQLSGGEQQRVAIARALANRPALLFADEPTGNLDPDTATKVFEGLIALVRETGLSALIATHNPELAAQMDRRVSVQNGLLTEV
ncbi:MAG: ABC transporter ATP-binding protein [Alphaproteobacteria bacterium]|nr:ABC transporter ATP-binding protein [Alphaproteobacteria bacterium]